MSNAAPWDEEYLLPGSVQVEHYDLYLRPKLENATFSGKVTIHLLLTEPRPFIAVHARGLQVTEPSLTSSKQPVILQDSFLAPKNDFYVVIPAHAPIQPGKYELSMKFGGSLERADIVGFYASRYKDDTGTTR